MKTTSPTRTIALACAIGSVALSPLAMAAPAQEDWQQLTAVGGGSQSRLAFSHWPNDKYLWQKIKGIIDIHALKAN